MVYYIIYIYIQVSDRHDWGSDQKPSDGKETFLN